MQKIVFCLFVCSVQHTSCFMLPFEQKRTSASQHTITHQHVGPRWVRLSRSTRTRTNANTHRRSLGYECTDKVYSHSDLRCTLHQRRVEDCHATFVLHEVMWRKHHCREFVTEMNCQLERKKYIYNTHESRLQIRAARCARLVYCMTMFGGGVT